MAVTPDKPLNVRVAEALGWTRCQLVGSVRHTGSGIIDERVWSGVPPDLGGEATDETAYAYVRPIPPYGEDSPGGWACTGPFISTYGIRPSLLSGEQGWTPIYQLREDGKVALPGEMAYDVQVSDPSSRTAPGCIAEAIVRLAAAGKLPK